MRVPGRRDFVVFEIVRGGLLVELPAQETPGRLDVPSIGAGANVPRSGVVANVAGLLALGVVSRQFVEAAAGTRRKSKPGNLAGLRL